MLVNRGLEAARCLKPGHLRLWHRSRRLRDRPAVILIPSILGTRLLDGRGRSLWATTRDLYFGPRFDGAKEVRTAGLLEHFTVVPAIFAHDVYGGLLRFLERIGGYRRDTDLFVLDYDWRTGIVDGARQLANLVRQVVARGAARVDLVGISTGGLIARYFLGHETDAAAKRARRAIYIGTPQRGTFHVVEMLVQGLRPAPWGRRFSGTEVAGLQTAWDCLPHPDERLFIDDRGEPLGLSHYDPEVWLRHGLVSLPRDELAVRLARARQLHDALDRSPVHRDAFVIGGRHLPTTFRARISRGKVVLSACQPQRDDPYVAHTYRPGDNSVPEASLRALPGLREERLFWVSANAHHLLPSEPEVHRLILEALFAPETPNRQPHP